MLSHCRGLSVFLLSLSAAACARSPELVPVQGRVLYNGAPLPRGTVIFQPAAGQPATGDLAADGSFELTTPGQGRGAAPGSYRVSVTAFAPVETPLDEPLLLEGKPARGESLIPEHYSLAATSGLQVEVPLTGSDSLLIQLADKRAP